MLRYAANLCFWCLALISFLVMVAPGAYAYIDPGTGSYLIQMAAAGVLAILFFVKTFWNNIRGGFARLVAKLRGEQCKK